MVSGYRSGSPLRFIVCPALTSLYFDEGWWSKMSKKSPQKSGAFCKLSAELGFGFRIPKTRILGLKVACKRRTLGSGTRCRFPSDVGLLGFCSLGIWQRSNPQQASSPGSWGVSMYTAPWMEKTASASTANTDQAECRRRVSGSGACGATANSLSCSEKAGTAIYRCEP